MSRIKIRCAMPQVWTDIPTPMGPDMQVRWSGHLGTPDASGPYEVELEYRVKPSIEELDAQGISREESDRT